MSSQPLLDQIAALRSLEVRGEAARSAGARQGLEPRLIRSITGHLATAGWSWLTIVVATPPPNGPTGDRRRTGN
jgi:hypothetical protein